MFCNPLPLLPRYHSSSPCKLSCSEPQRTLLSVELRILDFFKMFASMFLSFSKLCLASISCLFFKPFPAFSYGFQEFPSCNFLTFPTVSSISLVFQVCHSFFPPVSCFFSQFSSIFLHVHHVFNGFPQFSLVFSYLFPSVFRGPKENRTPPSPNCLVVHAPPKRFQLATLITTQYRDSCAPGQPPPTHPLYSRRSRKQLCLAYGWLS